ncbi:MAG: pilus assembly protein N-terminal domain-containing protein [Hyphomonadaceae bacterium]|nr:pilus assembly protein N-terminal domain-containing protein [Hyphomonadaceae bacterium]
MSRRIAITFSLLAAVCGGTGTVFPAKAAAAPEPQFTVAVDRARAIQNDHLIFLTGRSIGETNVVVVDRAGRTILDRVVQVVANESGAVVVTRGVKVERLHCAPVCAREETPGAAPAAN